MLPNKMLVSKEEEGVSQKGSTSSASPNVGHTWAGQIRDIVRKAASELDRVVYGIVERKQRVSLEKVLRDSYNGDGNTAVGALVGEWTAMPEEIHSPSRRKFIT